MKYLAQTGQPLGTIGDPNQGSGFGPFNWFVKSEDVADAAGAFTKIISNIIGIMTIIAGLWFLFLFISGAFGFLTAGGNSENVSKATKKIGTALIGLVVVVASYALISLLGELLGFKILDPQTVINKLGP